MRTVTVQAGVTIDLGHQYDNYATEVVFPSAIIDPFITNFGSSGTFAIWYRRSGDSIGYPIGSPLVTFDSTNSKVTWDVVESDTASPGVSQVQLRYIVDEVCVMSQIFAGNVADSVDTGTEVPEPMEQWADAIVSAGAGGQPTVATSASVMSDHNMIYLYTGSESGYIYGHIYYWNGSAWTDGGAYGGVSSSGTGLTDDIKQALLDCFEHVAWTDEHGQDYVDALEAALYPPAELVSISAVYTQSGTVYTTDSLDDLKSDLVVTATYTDNTTETVTTYTLSGTLTEGTSVITVSYGGKTTTFNVTVSAPATLSSITAVYTQSGTVYDTDSLDSLKSDLVVTAVYSDSTTQTVASTDYTLSGTLTAGTSTVTVSYGGKTTTFTVTVTEYVEPTPEIVTAINLPSGCYVDTEYVPTSLQYKYQIGVQFLDSNTPGNQLPFAGFNRLPASNTAAEEYWHIYFTTGNQNEDKNKQYIRWEVGAYKNSNTTFSTLRTANGINYTSSLITETPFFMTIKDGEQHLRANEAMTEELIKGSFSTVDATVAYSTVNADDPIDSFWLGKVHQAGSRTITEYSGGVKILCFNVFDANDNAIVSMHPAVFENKIGMYDSVRDKFYEAVGAGVTYDE